MYTMIERRKANPARLQVTMQRGQRDFFPRLQKAPGFTGFSLVADEANDITTAIIVWESKAQADAFDAETRGWMRIGSPRLPMRPTRVSVGGVQAGRRRWRGRRAEAPPPHPC